MTQYGYRLSRYRPRRNVMISRGRSGVLLIRSSARTIQGFDSDQRSQYHRSYVYPPPRRYLLETLYAQYVTGFPRLICSFFVGIVGQHGLHKFSIFVIMGYRKRSIIPCIGAFSTDYSRAVPPPLLSEAPVRFSGGCVPCCSRFTP